MIARLASVAIFGIAMAGCGVFDRTEPTTPPPPPTYVETANGDLEIITIPSLGDPTPSSVIDAPAFSDDPIADYLAYGGITNIPFFLVQNGRMVGMRLFLDTSAPLGRTRSSAEYTFAIVDTENRDLKRFAQLVTRSVARQYPGYTPYDDTSETRDYFDYRAVTLTREEQHQRLRIVVNAIRDSRYPTTIFLSFHVAIDPEPTPIALSAPVVETIGPLLDQANLTTDDVTESDLKIGWILSTADTGKDGMNDQPLSTQLSFDAGPTDPETVQAKVQTLIDTDWNSDEREVYIARDPLEPASTKLYISIRSLPQN